MISRIVLTGLLLVAMLPSHAQMPMDQERYLDSLQNLLRTAGHDTLRAKANIMLADYWMFKDATKARGYLASAKPLAQPYPFYRSAYMFFEGNLMIAEDHAVQAMQQYLAADSALSELNTSAAYVFRARVWLNYGILQQAEDEKKFADILLNKVIPFTQQGGDSTLLGKVYHDLSLAFRNTNQYEKAEEYFKKAIEVCLRRQELQGLAMAYSSAAENYVLWKKYPEAKDMLKRAREVIEPYPHSAPALYFQTAESMYFVAVEQYEDALTSIAKGVALAKEQGMPYEEQRLLLEKYYAYAGLKDHRNAKLVIDALASEPEMMSRVTNRLEIYKGMAETNAALGNMQPAYEWQQRYSTLSDSLHESQFRHDIRALESKFRETEQEKQIAVLKAKNARTLLLAAGSGLLLLAAVFGLLYYRNNKKLADQRLKDVEQQQQIRFSEALIIGEERERRRMAGDLHDGLGGMLTGVKMNIASMAEQDQGLHKVIYQLDNSIHELRRIARNMMPEALLSFGLETALKDLCDAMMTKEIAIRFQSYGIDAKMAQQQQVTIYRIVQELLANAIRHAQATDIFLECTQHGGTFIVTLEDNGLGFDTNATHPGMGLGNVRNRVAWLKGNIDISSAPQEGTTINIELHVA